MGAALAFLDVAELVLREHQGSLTSEDIVRLALERNELQTGGATPENSMRARISVDIAVHGAQSRFQRVGPNSFALRDWGLKEYKPITSEIVACLRQRDIDSVSRFFGYVDDFHPYFDLATDRGRHNFIVRASAESNDEFKQLISYILLEDEFGRVLSYRRGAYSSSARFLKGSYCIGFGGHVEDQDVQSLFGYRNGGVVACAVREIAEELGGLVVQGLEMVGVINDDSSLNGLHHFAFVFRGRLPRGFDASRQPHELGVSALQLLTPAEMWDKFHRFEFWSQLLIRRFFPKPPNFSGIVLTPRHCDHSRGPIVLVGEIASGKTEVAEQLKSAYGIMSVSTRDCVRELTQTEDFGTGDRLSFQEQAARLVSTEQGLQALADVIAERVSKSRVNQVIIDGVRNIGTVSRLRRKFPDLLLLYIEAPKDRAYEFFCLRSKRSPSPVVMAEFRAARNHPVEREVPLLKYRAIRNGAVIFNDGSLLELRRQLNDWWAGGAA